MDSTPKQGLAGKARRARDLTRSHRMYSQQLIEEYLDWESGEEKPERFIPIKRTCEFLPTAEVPASTSSDDSGAGQFEFDHTKQEPIVDRSAEIRSVTRLEKTQPVAQCLKPAALPPPAVALSVVQAPSVIRTPRARIDFRPEPIQTPALSTRGFLVGCGIGGAAAMLLLLMVGWLIG